MKDKKYDTSLPAEQTESLIVCEVCGEILKSSVIKDCIFYFQGKKYLCRKHLQQHFNW